ncbi:hypothetical protein HETIRDRAFT_443564 [Heterobasidion irregulare TC 32-1]|uniref:Survival protein SurE-like phosphatase/nucleotidase domain-containing protein n=1 Tax=Heterobasidion irregulare (strain TC 32-1) TaxID=747525 RepID=W4KIF4_HETIT|nr:uncharacterized protein HETIRDRAFT_443564 [Heterobasidion irregulare TC 32-1]ETW85643.1 hypothetical protein HETIRDRAFT_443564 [Heterobasidion irregulare TC 32-1]
MFARSIIALVALSTASFVGGLNILLTNDDSWASANIRATYTALKAAGHDVLMVAPAINQSGHGGTFVLPSGNITAPGGEFGSIPVGAPFFGQDATNPDLWYFNGTPAAAAIWGIDVIAPMHFGNKTIDLAVSGPNEGQNNGPFSFTISGTIGASYASVERGIPAIAFSAGNGTHRSFTTNAGAENDPANIAAALVTKFVAALAEGVKPSSRLLPLGLGFNVNFPVFGPTSNCTNPPFVLTRLTSGATINKLSIDPTTGLPSSTNIQAPGLNTVLNGLPNLPGETPTSAGCATAVSVYSVDYDAPVTAAAPIQAHLAPLFQRSHEK